MSSLDTSGIRRDPIQSGLELLIPSSSVVPDFRRLQQAPVIAALVSTLQ